MLFHVQMSVRLPPDLDPDQAIRLKAAEREMAQELQHRGVWRHLWRVAGCYANISVFDVAGPEELHETLSRLPLFPFMEITVQALCRHPSTIYKDDR